jgi:hypothetical protein
MKCKAGVWIDHRKAVVVLLTDAGEEIQEIASDMEKHVRFSSGSSEDGSTEDIRERQFAGHLAGFYQNVAAHLQNAEAILLFGPGEAKGELEKLLKGKGLGGRIDQLENADKMTDRQIAAKVRQHFFEQPV